MAAIARFVQMARAMEVPKLTTVATPRIAGRRGWRGILPRCLNQTGQHITIVNGEEEASLPGVLLGWPGSYGLVCDIGGSSMELRKFQAGSLENASDLGPATGNQGGEARAKPSKPPSNLVKQMGHSTVACFWLGAHGGHWPASICIDGLSASCFARIPHGQRICARHY